MVLGRVTAKFSRLLGQHSSGSVSSWMEGVLNECRCDKLVVVGKELKNYSSSVIVVLYHRWKLGFVSLCPKLSSYVARSILLTASSSELTVEAIKICWLTSFWLPTSKRITVNRNLKLMATLWYIQEIGSQSYLLKLYGFQISFFWLLKNNPDKEVLSPSVFFPEHFLLLWARHKVGIIWLRNKTYQNSPTRARHWMELFSFIDNVKGQRVLFSHNLL